MNKFTKGFVFGACLLGAVGALSACKQTPEEPKAETYTLIFDADNNTETTNIVMTIPKNALNDRTNWPIIADKNGWAGEWKFIGWEDNTATLFANYGDGSEENPYLIGNELSFKKMVDYVGTKIKEEVKYYKNQVESTVDDYDTKDTITTYATVITHYIQPTTGSATWEFETNKKFFRLVNDINFELTEIAPSGYSSFVLDGGIYNPFNGNYEGDYELNNVNESIFSSGKIFDIIVDSEIKNINVNLNEQVVSLVSYTRGGVYNAGTDEERRDTAVLKNITIDSNGQTITQTGNNESAFIGHVMTEANLLMEDCVMDVAKINSNSEWAGIFVGGYPRTNGKVTFKNCVNNADVTSTGNLGIFFGNDTWKTNTTDREKYIHEIINCKNTGNLIGNEKSHILVGFDRTGNQNPLTRFTIQEVTSLDEYRTEFNGDDEPISVRNYEEGENKLYKKNSDDEYILDESGNKILVFTNEGTFTRMEYKTAEIDGNNIILPASSLELEEGKTYTVTVNVENALLKFENGVLVNKGTFTTNIVVSCDITTESLTDGKFVIEDIYSSVADVTSYCEKYSIDAKTIEWADGGTCEYYWDKVNHCFVINTTEYGALMKNETNSSSNVVRFSIALMNGDNIIDIYTVDDKTNQFEATE